jgi:hypothetical protein
MCLSAPSRRVCAIVAGSWLAIYRGRLIVGSITGIVRSYLFQGGAWTYNDEKYQRMRVGRRWARAVLIADSIYVVGGTD